MKNFIIFLAILFSEVVFSQSKLLIYENNEYNNKISKYIVLNNNKAIFYEESKDYYVLENSKNNKQNNSINEKYNKRKNTEIKLIDKKANKYKEANFINKENSDNLFIFLSKWEEIKSLQNNNTDLFIDQAYNGFQNESKITINKKKSIKVKNLKNTKTINEYNCRAVSLKKNNEEYIVWITNDIDYAWVFLDDYSKLNGTVIKVEKNNKEIFSLKTIKDLEIKEVIFSHQDLFFLLTNWQDKKQ